VTASTRARKAVLFVHGVGEQSKSATMLYIGTPLVDWVLAFARELARQSDQHTIDTAVGEVRLSFVPFEGSAPHDPPIAVLHTQHQDLYMAEAWWAASTAHPNLATMLWWSLVHFGDIVKQLLRAIAQRASRLLPLPHRSLLSSQPDWWWQAVDLINCVGLAVVYVLAMVVGYPLILFLALLAQIPIEPVQNFVLLKLVRPLLEAGAGEFRMYLDDELQAANVRRRVAEAARELLDRSACEELIVVAHSEGAVVSLGMLSDPTFADVARRVRKFLTFGAGLNKSWLIDPTLDRIFGPLRGDVQWVDTWTAYDPVPAGALDPSRHTIWDAGRWRKCELTDVYQPDPPRPLESVQVSNGMNVLTDHGGYFANEEQVVIRLAAEVDCPNRTESDFWPDDTVLNEFVRRRRERVSALALWRDVAVSAWLLAAVVPWLAGPLRGVDPWAPIREIDQRPDALGWLVTTLAAIQHDAPPLFAPIASAAGVVLQVPALVGGAALLGILAWGIYSLGLAVWWQPWDRRSRAAFVSAVVHSALGRRGAD
jgi:hypothetical protein